MTPTKTYEAEAAAAFTDGDYDRNTDDDLAMDICDQAFAAGEIVESEIDLAYVTYARVVAAERATRLARLGS